MAFYDASQVKGQTNYNASKFKDITAALKSLKLNQYFNQFTEHNVDDETLLCLQKEDVEELISNTGDRKLFNQWLAQYKIKINRSKSSCLTCNGTKKIKQNESYAVNKPCPKCNGSCQQQVKQSYQKVTCSYCDGVGYQDIRCTANSDNCLGDLCDCCHGKGYQRYDCRACNMTGKVIPYQNKWEPCGNCNGSGKISGKGTINRWYSCPNCCNNSLKKNQVKIDTYINCTQCGGSGTETKAIGSYSSTPIYTCTNYACQGTGFWANHPYPSGVYCCPSCDGTGKTRYPPYKTMTCSGCHGSGKVKQ